MVEVPDQGQGKISVPGQIGREKEKENFNLLCLFVLLGPSVGWLRPRHIGEGQLLYSVDPYKCSSLLETPSQAHSEMFNHLWAFCGPAQLTY